MRSNLTINDLTIDCANVERARDFYADLLGWKKTTAFGALAVKTDRGMTILFWEPDIPLVSSVWPEEPGMQQKQMHLDFTVENVLSAVEKAIRLGATKVAMQYGGDSFVTMFDTEGHPFCLCSRTSETVFKEHFESKYFSLLADYSINIDCPDTSALRTFYAELTGWGQEFHPTSPVVPDGMNMHFMQSDFEYIPPVWPEEPGEQQKQMHFNFQVDDLPSTVDEAIRLGATKATEQYGGDHFVALLDPVGHPFCLCRRG